MPDLPIIFGKEGKIVADPARSVQIDDAIDVSRLPNQEISEGIPGISLLGDKPGRLSWIEGEAARHSAARSPNEGDERILVIGSGAAKLEAVLAVYPIQVIAQDNGIV